MMLSSNIIEVKDLTKKYRLYDSPIDRLKEAFHPFRKRYHRDFLALNGVSLQIPRGEIVGIVGKNGSGKSTLLKILAGVLSPSSGNIKVNGKVAALLELGAGFNPELTGIENVYLNGAIMGYSREEMDVRAKPIIEFADIGEFIDQPVRLYSSGMFARLAFSVAINVEPDILIIDEALSVGDFIFQFKCMRKIADLRSQGITILLVSHSTQQILQNCSYALFLDSGRLEAQSRDVEEVINCYERSARLASRPVDNIPAKEILDIGPPARVEADAAVNECRMGTFDAVISSIRLTQANDGMTDDEVLTAGLETQLEVQIDSKHCFESIVIGMSIRNVNSISAWGDNTLNCVPQNIPLHVGVNRFVFRFLLNIVAGEYLFFIGLADISTANRVELDQRWPIKKLTIVSRRPLTEGFVYSPLKLVNGPNDLTSCYL